MALLTDLLADFEQSLKRRDLSPQTVHAYHWALHDLIDKAMAPARLHRVSQLTREVLEEWQDSHIERSFSPRSRGLAITSVRQLIKFGSEAPKYELEMQPKLERALAKVKQPEAEPHPIPEEDLRKIQDYLLPLSPDATLEHLRDRALFIFILNTGARVSEALRPTRFDYERPTVIQKGGTKKTLNVHPRAAEIVADYLRARTDDRPELFLVHKRLPTHERDGVPMNPADVRKVWHKLSKKLGLTYWTTHAIRHTCATLLLDAEIDHLVIAEHLGHHGVGTIANYAKVRDKSRQKVLNVMGAVLGLPPPSQTEAA